MQKKTTTESLLPELKQLLMDLNPAVLTGAFVGLDGFIDNIQKAVVKNENGEPAYFRTIHDFAAHLDQMDGKSGQVELITKQVKIGGNAPILSNTLGKFGVKSKCFGAMGYPEINPLFKGGNQIADLISISPPGISNAIEFENGKIIFSDLSAFKGYDWSYVKARANFSMLKKAVAECRLIVLVDWANLQYATDLWRGFLNDVVIPAGSKDQFFFFDLCDPSKKSPDQIRELLNLVSSFSDYGKVILGLNENEATMIWLASHGLDSAFARQVEIPTLETVGYHIYRSLSIDTLLIHPRDRTLVFKNQKNLKKRSVIELKGRVIENPNVQTGGGDNLNAGFCLGLLAGFEIQDCMLLGMATSGAYVKNGHSPGINDLIDYIEEWSSMTGAGITQEKEELVKDLIA